MIAHLDKIYSEMIMSKGKKHQFIGMDLYNPTEKISE